MFINEFKMLKLVTFHIVLMFQRPLFSSHVSANIVVYEGNTKIRHNVHHENKT
jgi:hypothetical protein